MGIFVRNSAIAVSWTPTTCHAVRLQGGSNSCQVAAAWSGECAGGDALPELVARAVNEVGANDSIFIVAGGSGQGWGMADLTLPRLKTEELRNALEFEVRKRAPLPGDKLHWGYRLLPSGRRGRDTRQGVRLYYVRNEHWESWLKAIGALHHVDAMLPAPVALDPLLDQQTLALPGEAGGCEYRSEGGLRVVASGTAAPTDLAAALPFPGLNPGVLEALSAAERLAYAPALLLAMYGMSDAVLRDRGTLYPLPEHLVAHRYVALKGIAAGMTVYLLCLLVFTVTGSLQFRAAQIRRVELAITQTRKELEAVNKLLDPKDAERGSLLRKELEENTDRRPDFPAVLLEVTRAVKPPAWVSQSLEWRDGALTVQVQSPTKDLELAARLEASPYIGDVTERLSSFNQSNSSYVQRFECVARFDTPEEKEVLKIQREKERARAEAVEKARQAAEREAAAAELAAAEAEEEDDEDDDEAGGGAGEAATPGAAGAPAPVGEGVL